MAARNRRLAELAESARQHARDSRNTKESRAKEAEAVHQKRLLMISEQKDRGASMGDDCIATGRL